VAKLVLNSLVADVQFSERGRTLIKINKYEKILYASYNERFILRDLNCEPRTSMITLVHLVRIIFHFVEYAST
jgi:hypothetical protein